MSGRNGFRWKDALVVAGAMALAWGLRGQHGHERGAAMAGAMAGLALAAVTGGPRWIGAAVIGSLGFAIGGALSYGRFVEAAYRGSWEAVRALALVGFVWGGLGGLTLGLGLALSRYRVWERVLVGLGLFFVWFLVDRLLWGRLTGPEDLRTREMMAVVLLAVWVLLAAYAGIFRKDSLSLKLAVAGGVGFAAGFPLAAWVQGAGSATGIPVSWWKIGEHLIGFCGGLSLACVALRQKSAWVLPASVRPWERWAAVAWLLWFLPSWLLANNLDYWVSERTLLPVWTGKVVWVLLFLGLAGLAVWGALEIRRGRIFVTSWMPRHLKTLFLVFLWLTTLIACSKTLASERPGPTPLIFLSLAFLVAWAVRSRRQV